MKTFDSLIGPATRAALHEHEELLTRVSRNVPPQAAVHIVYCRLVEGRLRLVMNSAGWVAKLRFAEVQLVRVLAQDGVRVRSISWHVAPPGGSPAPAAPAKVSRQRSAGTAALVSSVATGMEDGRLKKALTRLAKTLKPH